MIAETIALQYVKLSNLADFLTKGRFWLMKVTLMAVIAALFMSFPGYDIMLRGEYPSGWGAVLQKVANPFLDMSLHYGEGSHDSKLTFRLTVPILAHSLHLGIKGLIGLQFVAGVLSLCLSGWVAYQISSDRKTGLFTALLVAGTYAGTTAFVELRGIFDGVAIFFLLLAMGFRNPWIIGFAVFLASWTDERGFIAAFFVIIFHVISNESGNLKDLRNFIHPRPLAVIMGVLGYLISRVILAYYFHLTTSFLWEHGLHLKVDGYW
jgi:hypothetical protein